MDIENNAEIQYIIYCRKSTDETSEHQKQSIPDQIKACIDYAEREGLIIAKKPENFQDFETENDINREDTEADIESRRVYQSTRDLFIIKEQETGKIPYKRKKWRKLIERIKKGEIQGLLSYSPDRQARNMLEGGELINYVDEGLVTLKYTNFHFEDNASGKMMLGIWFVFSKQYSDKLSEDVTRGNGTKIGVGKAIGKPKPGYFINDEGFHEPHETNFPLIKEAFEMKLNGETDEKITKYINIHGYKRILKKSGKELIMNSKNIGKIWVDEFYYGILIHGEATQDLREVNPYYKPVISEEQFQILKDRKEDRNKRGAVTKKKDVYEEISPFSNEFILTEDGYRLTFTLPNVQRFKKKLEKEKKENPKTTLEDVVNLDQMWFRCANRNSQFHNYQVKADAVDSAILDMLQGFTIGEKEYNEYVDFAKQQIDKIDYENKEKRVKKTLELNRIDSQKKEYIKNNMGKVRDDEERMIYNRERDTYDAKLAYIKKEIDDIDKEERNEIFEIEVLVGTMHNIPKYYKKLSNVRKRYITEILFSNVVLDHEKRLHIQVKPGFENLFSVNGGPAGARTQDLKLKRLPL